MTRFIYIYLLLFQVSRIKLQENQKSKGFGDTIANITNTTGIAKIVKMINPNCGCDKRQEWLNKKIPYKN